MVFASPLELATSTAISNWFIRRRSFALALLGVTQGSGLALMPLLAQQMITVWGWRHTWALLGFFTMITGVAISPLLGVGAYGAWTWFRTPSEQKDEAHWYARPAFWIPALLIVGIVFLKDVGGAAIPDALKQPLDVVEAVESKVSGLVAAGAFIPIAANFLPSLGGPEAQQLAAPDVAHLSRSHRFAETDDEGAGKKVGTQPHHAGDVKLYPASRRDEQIVARKIPEDRDRRSGTITAQPRGSSDSAEESNQRQRVSHQRIEQPPQEHGDPKRGQP